MRDFPVRRNPRLAEVNYLGRHSCFVTFCCFERQPVFREERLSGWLVNLLKEECVRLHFGLHAYCLMPDHLHFLVEGLEKNSDVLRLLKSVKLKSSRRYAKQAGGVLWQKGFYERVLRANEPVEDVAWYIWLNPVRKGIVEKPADYPLSRSFTGLQMPAEWSKPGWRPPWK